MRGTKLDEARAIAKQEGLVIRDEWFELVTFPPNRRGCPIRRRAIVQYLIRCASKTRSAAVRPRSPANLRHIYFVRAENGLIKIGVTDCVEARLKGLRGGSPVSLTLIGSMRGDSELERALHIRFAAHRKHGEWFAPSEEILAFIEQVTGVRP